MAVLQKSAVLAFALASLWLASIPEARGNSTQFEWRVVGLSNTYSSKEAAHDALLNRGGNYAYLDKEENISDMSGEWVTYKYSVKPRPAVVLSEWDYHVGTMHFPTEAELYAAGYQNLAENYSAPECPPTLEPAPRTT